MDWRIAGPKSAVLYPYILREMKNIVKNENVPLTPYSEALCMLT